MIADSATCPSLVKGAGILIYSSASKVGVLLQLIWVSDCITEISFTVAAIGDVSLS